MFIIMIITSIVIIAIGIIYNALPQEKKTWIDSSLGIYTNSILVQGGSQILPIRVSHETYIFARDNLKQGEEITLYYRAAGNKRLCYDPYHTELLYEIPQGGIKASFIKIIESDYYSKNNPREPWVSGNFTTYNLILTLLIFV